MLPRDAHESAEILRIFLEFLHQRSHLNGFRACSKDEHDGFHICVELLSVISRFVPTQALGFGVSGTGDGGGAEGICTLGDTFALGDFPEGEEEDLDIHPHAQLAGIAQVEGYALTEGEVVATVHLRQAGNAGAYAHAVAAGGGIEGGHLLGNPRARADEGHVAGEDVEQLGEFIQRAGAQKLANPGGALLVRQQVTLSIAGIAHGTELNDTEATATTPHALLQEERVPTLEDEQEQQDNQQEGRNEQQQHSGKEEVTRSLARSLIEGAAVCAILQEFDFFCDFHSWIYDF